MKNARTACLLLLMPLALTACFSADPWGERPTAAQTVPNPLSQNQDMPPAPPAVPVEPTTREVLNPPSGMQGSIYDSAVYAEGYGTDRNAFTYTETPERAPAAAINAAPSVSAPQIKVALLAPLSGSQAKLGQALLQAAQLALFDMNDNSIALMPQDTQGTAEGARMAAEKALGQGAQLILGPLFASEVRGAAPVANSRGVSMLAFSTDWTLAGGNTYIMGFLPFSQVERVSAYAFSQGLQKIGVIAPDNPYGRAVTSAFNDVAGRFGAGAGSGLLYINQDNAQTAEKVSAFTAFDARQAAVVARQEAPAPFDAVLMPFGGNEAITLSDLLNYFELPPQSVRRLGTGLMDDAALAAEPSLQGALFAAAEPQARIAFEGRYLDSFGERPPRLSTLAYDGMALAIVLARSGAFNRQALTNPNGFAGIDGIFRFRADNLAERGLAILELRQGRINVVDPAPRTFQNLGQ